ncbi:hypothetical protein MAR_001748 [Mya arenaria]|uniref:Uncharacterized protein n=1 Tax=Mya arenaria TaxID=6604 RepID=A0ABY7FCJ3_MYAAR|nr:hypothetical protein MAR_001748 [Mya arenaria]
MYIESWHQLHRHCQFHF